jgi:RNAse (barnase) inhibitor barstar
MLLSPSPPWIVTADLSSDTIKDLIESSGQVGVVLELDGGKARTLDAFFSLCSESLEFPDYFGRNWQALRDCLADLEWLPAEAYCLVFRNSELLFRDEPIERSTFLINLKLVAEEWATPVELGEWWDRPAIPFHTVLDLGVSCWKPDHLTEVGELF